jgi:hypothetical protein
MEPIRLPRPQTGNSLTCAILIRRIMHDAHFETGKCLAD